MDVPAAEWNAVSVRYPYEAAAAVGPASLRIGQGERVLLLGASGSGKSTLLNTLTGLVPQAMPAGLDGQVCLFGEPVSSRPPAAWAGTAARLFQNPEETLCGMTVADEIAFALENRAMAPDAIVARTMPALAEAGLPPAMLHRRTSRLSGGEKQLVALAALLAQQTPLVVIDEPTAHLAPAAAARLRQAIMREAGGRSVIVVDHRLDDLPAFIDRAVFIDAEGRVQGGEPPRAFFRRWGDELSRLGISPPPAVELDHALLQAGIRLSPAPLTMAEAVAALDALDEAARTAARVVVESLLERGTPPASRSAGAPLVSLSGADCAPLFGPVVLSGISLSIRPGETVALLGPNGAGKSTLGASLAGMLRLRAGRRDGPPGAISFQNPENQFLAASVGEELRAAMPGAGEDEVHATLASWGLADLARRHPFELSHGQKRRLSLAAITAPRRHRLLVLDEPTAGLDAAALEELAATIARLAASAHAVVLITHDIDFAARCCRRAVIVGGGGILADGPARTVLHDAATLAAADLAAPSHAPLRQWMEAGRC